ncbi:hypothetical protein DOTSEDRAFT_72694 [Dothistroma septosporum NZE10]|uniref:Serine hydrolase domain-containing protein n=1 Tax=Dothistroma septosporum (strain NZE10 / CBS 128990) TaxID=675120 RepID=M2WMZ7_DOTSN|nr:hypothetical protein DOTSEDRAFT_72694 [Dothistroma septosporum NZE10]
MIAPIETTTIIPGILDTEVQLVTENYYEKAVAALPARRKLRVLALHGFGQSGDYLRIAMKTGQLEAYLKESLHSDQLSQYDGVEWLCPNGPLHLVPDSKHGAPERRPSTAWAVEEVDIYAWWRVLEFHIEHEHLYQSIEYLCDYLTEHGPVDGIVGFSQGAAVAMMLTALCEGTPGRIAALAGQAAPFVVAPPQAPFKFAVSCCGFQGATKYYNGFYNPKISTPSLHVVAEFDTMVSAERSTSLADACEDASIVHFRGTHHVPTDKASLYEMARFIANACSDKSTPSPVGVTYSLPPAELALNELFKQTTITTSEVPRTSRGYESPDSTESSSPGSSLSGFSSNSSNRKSRMRVITRRTAIVRMIHGSRNASRSGSRQRAPKTFLAVN